MELFPSTSSGEVSLAGCTLVLPAVSTANVGQLAVDLLISTLALPRVAYLEHDAVLPCVGNDPYVAPCGNVATSMELYADASKALVVMQQRAPVTPGAYQLLRNIRILHVKVNSIIGSPIVKQHIVQALAVVPR